METKKVYYSKKSSLSERVVEVDSRGSFLIEHYGCYLIKKGNTYRGVDYIYDDSKILEAVKEGK